MLAIAGAGAAAAPAADADTAAAGLAPWRAAVVSPDPAALADVTVLPFLFEGRRLGRQAFIAEAAPALFTAPVRRCLRAARASKEDGRLVFWCKPYAFYLAPVRGRWQLIEFGVDVP
jgi:hypothetical protein